MSSAAGSLFARIYAGHTGVDPYTTAVSDLYQDLFDEGIFTGKGLYDVDAFMAALENRVPENAVLSHDLFEGLYARTALVSDIEVVDDYPSSVLAHARRQHRWVSRAAVAHDAVIESFMAGADAVVPMKLFTLFTSDARALEQIQSNWAPIETLIRRLSNHAEWGMRLVFDESRAPAEDKKMSVSSGRGYLLAKRQHRAATVAHAKSMRKIAGGVLKALGPLARDSRQRSITAPAEGRSRLLLDAAFLVPRAKATRFKASVLRQAKKLAPSGYALQLTGPWPPYSFVENA